MIIPMVSRMDRMAYKRDTWLGRTSEVMSERAAAAKPEPKE